MDNWGRVDVIHVDDADVAVEKLYILWTGLGYTVNREQFGVKCWLFKAVHPVRGEIGASLCVLGLEQIGG